MVNPQMVPSMHGDTVALREQGHAMRAHWEGTTKESLFLGANAPEHSQAEQSCSLPLLGGVQGAFLVLEKCDHWQAAKLHHLLDIDTF